MTIHLSGAREEWFAARLKLLKEEKELTRPSDELAWRRQELADLFQRRLQLLVYYEFGPDDKAGGPSCASIADGFNGIAVRLANLDVMLWVSRPQLAKLQAYTRRMGWTFPWTASAGSDFKVPFAELQQREGTVENNYQRGGHALDAITVPEPFALFALMGGSDAPTDALDRPGPSVFHSRTASSTTPIPPICAGWTAFGACTRGSTAGPRDVTRQAPGSAATTSTRSEVKSW